MNSKIPSVLIPLAPGFEEIEAVTVIDLLRRAGFEVVTASVNSGKSHVEGAHGIRFDADVALAEVEDRLFSAVVLPGGMPGTRNLISSSALGVILRRHRSEGRWLGAICAAPSVLGGLGLLKGLRATCFPGYEEQLAGAVQSTESVVEDRLTLTSRGPGTAIPFGLKLIEILGDRAKADEIRTAILAPKI